MDHQQVLRDAYFAGLIDGEGSIYLCKNKGTLRLEVKVNMTCEKTIVALQEHFAAGSVRLRKKQHEHHRQQWMWRVICNDARIVLTRIRPFLITKAETTDRALAHPLQKKGPPSRNAGMEDVS